MSTVYTKDELKEALKRGDSKIVVRGELAKKILKSRKFSKSIAGAVAAAGLGTAIATIPVVGAFAVPALAVGTSITLSAGELFIICGTGLCLVGLLKNYNVKFTKDGSVEITKQ